MKDINLNNIKVFYEQEYDGGGYRLVDGLFNHPRVKEIVKGKQSFRVMFRSFFLVFIYWVENQDNHYILQI